MESSTWTSWLQINLHHDHPLFNSRLWNSNRFHNDMCPAVLGGSFYNAQSGLRATGVPCHLIVAQAVEELGKEVGTLRNEVVALKDTIPERVKDKILEHFVVNGAVPLTREDVGRMLVDMRDQMLDAIREQGGQRNPPATVEDGAGADSGGTVQADGFKTWVWNGRFHHVPCTFRFPKCTVKQLWACIGLAIRTNRALLLLEALRYADNAVQRPTEQSEEYDQMPFGGQRWYSNLGERCQKIINKWKRCLI